MIAPSRRSKRGLDVVGRVDGLADVVQQGRQQELLVVRPLFAGQLEDLEAVIERIPFGMILGALLDALQRLEQHPEEQEGVDVVFQPLDLGLEVDLGIFLAQEGLQLGDRGPLDGLAGDRALEDVMGLVFGIERQLEVDSDRRRGCA